MRQIVLERIKKMVEVGQEDEITLEINGEDVSFYDIEAMTDEMILDAYATLIYAGYIY